MGTYFTPERLRALANLRQEVSNFETNHLDQEHWSDLLPARLVGDTQRYINPLETRDRPMPQRVRNLKEKWDAFQAGKKDQLDTTQRTLLRDVKEALRLVEEIEGMTDQQLAAMESRAQDARDAEEYVGLGDDLFEAEEGVSEWDILPTQEEEEEALHSALQHVVTELVTTQTFIADEIAHLEDPTLLTELAKSKPMSADALLTPLPSAAALFQRIDQLESTTTNPGHLAQIQRLREALTTYLNHRLHLEGLRKTIEREQLEYGFSPNPAPGQPPILGPSYIVAALKARDDFLAALNEVSGMTFTKESLDVFLPPLPIMEMGEPGEAGA